MAILVIINMLQLVKDINVTKNVLIDATQQDTKENKTLFGVPSYYDNTPKISTDKSPFQLVNQT